MKTEEKRKADCLQVKEQKQKSREQQVAEVSLNEDDADFRRTVKECKDLCQVWWERQGRKMSCGESDGNATTWIFNMKNRFGWKDKTETEHTGNVAVTQITRRIVKAGDGTGH